MPEESYVEIAVEVQQVTDGAIRVNHEMGDDQWIPKSVIQLQEDDQPINGSEPDWASIETIQVAEWFADWEGMI